MRFQRFAFVLCLASGALTAAPARAGLLEALFGARTAPAPHYRAYAPLPPAILPEWIPPRRPASRPENRLTPVWPRQREGAARVVHVQTGGRAWCVRTCDGFYFPLGGRAQTGASDAELCSFICPGTQLEVFRSSGEDMSLAVGATGRLYKELPQAFSYRKASIPACGCRKLASYAEWAARLLADPTLKAGDLVVNEQSAALFTGTVRKDRPIRTSELRDIERPGAVTAGTLRQADRLLGFTFRRGLAQASGFAVASAREPISITVTPTRPAAIVASPQAAAFRVEAAPGAAARVVNASPFR